MEKNWMLNQATHWMEIAGTAVDALLLFRILVLRLHRVYLFITLSCVLAVFFDLVGLRMGDSSPEYSMVFIYSRFLYAVVFPLVAWEVFEEIKAQVGKLRRLAVGRLISGIFFTILFGLLMTSVGDTDESGNGPSVLAAMAIVLWAGASTASLAFLVTIHRFLRGQPLFDPPNNTSVLLSYFELSFLGEVLYCVATFVLPLLKSELTSSIMQVLFMAYAIAITVWCSWRLKSIPSGLSSESQKAHP
jgi:hypothetical protein